jgi:hypothetical protein
MAIKNENKILDFRFSDEKLNINYKIRSHITEGMGQTISISPDGKKYVHFPANMFYDIVEFLTNEGVFVPVSNFSQNTEELQLPNVSTPPNMIEDSPENYSGVNQPHYSIPSLIEPHLNAGMEKMGPDTPVGETPVEMKQEAVDMMRERLAAKAKANKAKSIKKID